MRPWLAITVALVGCQPPPGGAACLTAADCSGLDICVAGGCVSGMDGGRGDAGESDAGDRSDVLVPDTGPTGSPDSGPAEDGGRDAGLVDTGSDAGGPFTGDTCSSPTTILLASGHGHAEDALSRYTDDYTTPFCGGAGPDVVYTFDTEGPGDDLDVALRVTDGDGVDTVISWGTGCDETSELGGANDCDDDRSPGDSNPVFHLHHAPARETYYVWIDGNTAADLGPFALDVDALVAHPDECSAAALDLTGGAKINGGAASSPGVDVPIDTCGASAGVPDGDQAVFRFTAPSDGEISYIGAFTFSRPASITLRETCSGADVVCATGTAAAGPSLRNVPVTPGRTYYIVVHGIGAPSGLGYSLELSP